MFALKRFVVVEKNQAIISRNYKQIWCALRSAISVALKILMKNLPVKDIETYQQMMRVRTDEENFLCVLLRLFSGLISVQHRSLYDK